MTSAVVFDFGGVLFNWQPFSLLQAVLPHRAPDAQAAQALAQTLFQSFGPGCDWSEFDRGALSWDEVRDRMAARTGVPAYEVEQVMAAIPGHLEPVAATVQWLERLAAQGVPLYYLSNMPQPYAAYLVREHAFLAHFRGGVFSCDVKQVKPHAAIFETAAQQLGLDVSQTVFIDDHPRNIETARSLGWRAVVFEDAARCEQQLRAQGWLA